MSPAEYAIIAMTTLLCLCHPSNALSSQSPSQRYSYDSKSVPYWQQDHYYLAPTENRGWGVFAGRRFRRGEIVTISPLLLRFPEESPLLKQTMLDNYHYSYFQILDEQSQMLQPWTILGFGVTLFFNHASSDQTNIQFRPFGQEPSAIESPNERCLAIGYYAKRDIMEGEELLCSYGSDEWFSARGFELLDAAESSSSDEAAAMEASPLSRPTMALPKATTIVDSISYSTSSDNDINSYPPTAKWKPKYGSKLYSGYSRDRFRRAAVSDNIHFPSGLTPYNLQDILQKLPTFDAGYQQVICKSPVKAGSVLEVGPALLVPAALVLQTVIEPISFLWKDLLPDADYTVKVYQVDPATQQRSFVDMHISETALVPLSGSIGMLLRSTEDDQANARLEVAPDPYNEHGYSVRVVATQDIECGASVILYWKDHSSTSDASRVLLLQELLATGQSVPVPEKDDKLYEMLYQRIYDQYNPSY